ncbi:MAG: VOC family protein [Planctomycetota bacterium]|nr:VOC family protein [Planctomycetota bacterium]
MTASATTTPSTTDCYRSIPCGLGEFCWHECTSPNPQAAERFYTAVLECTSETCPKSPFPHTMLSAGGHPFLGLTETPTRDVAAHWLGYITVGDLDAACKLVPTLGGTIRVGATDIDIGRLCIITDCAGAVVCLFQPHEGKTDGVNWFGPGLVGWNELVSTNPTAAVAFYTKLLGWTAAENNSLGFQYWMFSSQGRSVAGLLAKCASDKSPTSYWMQYLQTADLDRSFALAKSHGATACCEPMDIPSMGRTAYCIDPNGATFGLWQPATAPKNRCGSGSYCCE